MASYTPIYQKRGEEVVPVITIDDAPSAEASAAGHLVDSNGIANEMKKYLPLSGGTMTGVITLREEVCMHVVAPGNDHTDLYAFKAGFFGTNKAFTATNYFGAAITENSDTSITRIDCRYAVHFVNVNKNTMFRFVMPTFPDMLPSRASCVVTLRVMNAGAYTCRWDDNVRWAGGTPPELTASGYDILTFITFDGGAYWYGTMSAADAK